ncbi:MAG TPA: hypothetical protein VMW16_14725 [Sedimentisphaerales bacterium]|nr:hypothetical protein [Sedimentisphaerales bacterium]
MRLRDIIVLFVCGILAVALLGAAGTQLDYINSQRQELKLISNTPLENAPPSLAFATVAMGAFRGLVVDILWMRAETLKEEGQFFDAKQLADWITTLQPRFAAVWDFQSWNMAYNISVAIPATQPEERWRWVKNGYELLRDQGIALNPKSVLLYRQLAFMFQHKIGALSDDAHKYYKLQLAEAMEPLLGPADNRYFEALAKAPTEWRQIENDPNIRPLITALKAADKAFTDNDSFVANYLSLRQNPSRFSSAAFETIDSFRGTRALDQFDIFARAYQLRNTWKLDPVLMHELNKVYGPIDWSDPNKHLPLDWRHPDSHAIYWSVKGLQIATRQESREVGMDETNTDRMVGHSLQNLFRYGKIFIYDIPPEPSGDSSSQTPQTPMKEVYLRPDLRMFEPYNKSMLATLEKYKAVDRGVYESMQTGHRNMLRNAILSFYQSGHKIQAQKIYDQMRQLYPRAEVKVPLVVFVRNRFLEELKSLYITNANEIVQMLLRESYFLYAMRDDDEAYGRENLAKEIHDYYMSAWEEEHRIDLPEFPLLRYLALVDFLNDRQYAPGLRLALRNRIRIERPDLYAELTKQQDKLRKQSEQPQ